MMNNLRKQFPILVNNPNLIYLDNAATTLKPGVVLDKMMEYYTQYGANIHRGIYPMSERATEEYERGREKVAGFIGANMASELVFTRGTTESLNLVADGWARRNLEAGDEVVVEEMGHHANLLPWQRLALEMGLVLRYVPIGDGVESLVTAKTRIVAMTAMSNVLGQQVGVGEVVVKIRRANPKVVVVVDGAQAVGHGKVNVVESGADFWAFSGHKMYGPTGIGGLWARTERWKEMEPLMLGGGAVREVSLEGYRLLDGPQGFEAGTPPIAEAIGLGAAVDFVESVGRERIELEEERLAGYAYEKLVNMRGLKVLGKEGGRIVSLSVEGVHPHDLADYLGKYNICVRAGHHCAMPLHTKLGLKASLRISFGLYNSEEEVDRLVEKLDEVIKLFQNG